MNSDIVSSVKASILWLDAWEFKTLDYFLRVLSAWVYDLWNKEIEKDEFIDRLADLIQQQLTRAWNEGMRANGLEIADMLDEWQEELNDIIANEYSFVDRFADDIVAGREGDVAQFQARAALWAKRYDEVVNRASVVTASKGAKKVWRLGATEKHCPFCKAFNGIVAFASEWEELNVYPQHAPNPVLTGTIDGEKGCEGWQCDCKLENTDRRRTPKAFTTIMNIVSK